MIEPGMMEPGMMEPGMMRAAVRERYGSADVLEIRECPTPDPGDDEVLVKVVSASVNTADIDGLTGVPFAMRIAFGLRRPRRKSLGLDVAGTVQAVGQNVESLRVGDDVWADLSASRPGSFADYVCIPERVASAMPAGVSFETAAMVPHSAVLALQALRARGGVNPGDRVLINGAGGCVGPFAIQLAKHFGAEVTGVDCAEKLDLMRSVGADHVVDYRREDVRKNGEQYDLILDIAGHRSILRYRKSLTADGRYILVAHSLASFFRAALLGRLVGLLSDQRIGNFHWQPSRREDLALLGALLVGGVLRPVIDSRWPLEGLPDAVRRHMSGAARGKAVVVL